ncbi:HWE histidine kinase domain-containing protein [Phenylobacterium montanum]|uniref:histidine kinase n=1 Tax=Phenylobacterium montanum TaxID=2823693 RepID=A0A975ISV7_9CAUL|nr:HWE histidine kinase domain-containing protein [Caulobacter sp. S6]QUD86085.1 PAS domain-containing protein [Caulobacter sp. S6]
MILPPGLRRGGLRPLAAIGAAAALVLIGLAMAVYNENQSRAQKLREAAVQAHILAASVSAALAFDDARLAQEYVDALAADRDIQAAGVYGLNGKLVAGYSHGAKPPPANQLGAPALGPDRIVVSAPVTQGSAALGSIWLETVQEPLTRRAARYGGIAMLVVMAALLVAVLGRANARLMQAHSELETEMEERARAENALRLAREQEAAAQLELADQRSRAALRQTEQQLEFALDAGRMGSWAIDLETGALTASEFFRANFGLGPGAPLAREEDLDRYIHPDDRAQKLQARDRAVRDGSDLESEYRTIAPDGVTRWILVRGQASYDERGTATRLAGVSLDITQRKQAEERQRLLVDELNHRVKNTLATVQSIAVQTRRVTATAETFEAAFLSRLGALARVHDLLSRISWEGASLADVVRQTLSPYVSASDQARVLNLEGPDVRLGPNAAVTLAMAFHELATNAAKYGALSAAKGRVTVRWSADDPRQPSLIEITWREAGGPPVVRPQRRGFGSRFIERGLAREFDGKVDLDFTPEGVCCRMRMPLSPKLRMAA